MTSITKSERAMKLMAYADGELEGDERAEVAAWLAADAEAVLFANDLAHLGGLVVEAHRTSKDAASIASFDVADAIAGVIRSETTARTQMYPKFELESAAASKKAEVRSLADERARRTGDGSSRGRVRYAGYAVAALALAASVFLVTRHKDEEPLARMSPATVQPSRDDTNPNGAGVDVSVAENAGQSVSVFYLPNDSLTNVTTSVVVWVDESGGK